MENETANELYDDELVELEEELLGDEFCCDGEGCLKCDTFYDDYDGEE